MLDNARERGEAKGESMREKEKERDGKKEGGAMDAYRARLVTSATVIQKKYRKMAKISPEKMRSIEKCFCKFHKNMTKDMEKYLIDQHTGFD
ncbi:Hypothetical predicted protein [Octopus vulgaris]|uniref:Uncharacterized protein n=1 Tax=Octopus vulgaris TaxID=6645 RepID=A0AA36BGQ7_OCTVU|nr:Hypothetical predicted protein [Octopus vulgaris]